ncbi:MAG: class I lanthipeptide [Acidobacteriota bacterium]
MKKKIAKKLTLSKETLQNLTIDELDKELREVAAGGNKEATVDGCSAACSAPC